MLNYDWGLITDKEHDFLPYHSLTKTWLITWSGTVSQLGGWVSVNWVSGEGNVVTISEGLWRRIPHSKEVPLGWLLEEIMFMLCRVHLQVHACIFPKNFWTCGSISIELDGGKVRIPEISSNCPLKIGGCGKERDLIVPSVRKGGSEKSTSHWTMENWHHGVT